MAMMATTFQAFVRLPVGHYHFILSISFGKKLLISSQLKFVDVGTL
jgi:hypothetical protein